MSYRELFSLFSQKIEGSADSSKILDIRLSKPITSEDRDILENLIKAHPSGCVLSQTGDKEPKNHKNYGDTVVYFLELDSMEIYCDGESIAQIAPPTVVMAPPPAPAIVAPCYSTRTTQHHRPFELPRERKGTPPVADTFDQDGKQIGWQGTHQEQERRRKLQASEGDLISAGGAPG